MQRGKIVPRIFGKNIQVTLNSCKSKVKQQQNTVLCIQKGLVNILSRTSKPSIPPKRPFTVETQVTFLIFRGIQVCLGLEAESGSRS
jgi:hypothetical protein